MNTLLGTLLIFSAIFLVFFGAPIILLGVTSWFFPPENVITTLQPIELPNLDISIKKVMHKGQIIWVDAE